MELNHVHEYKNNMLSASDFVHQDNRNRMLGIIDDISLTVKDRDVENIDTAQEPKNFRVGILQMLCLEELNEQEADTEKRLLK